MALLQVIASACQCLCSLARLQPSLTGDISYLASLLLMNLRRKLDELRRPPSGAAASTAPPGARLAALPKPLFVLGNLCRHGAALIDAVASDAEQDSGR